MATANKTKSINFTKECRRKFLRVEVEHVDICEDCVPYEIYPDSPHRYHRHFQCRSCLSGCGYPPAIAPMRKIELFYCIFSLNKTMPYQHYNGLRYGLQLGCSNAIIRKCNQVCPDSLHRDFKKYTKVQIEYCFFNRGKIKFKCQNSDISVMLSSQEVEANLSSDDIDKGRQYRKRLLGCDTSHPYVGLVIDILHPDYLKFEQFSNKLRYFIQNYQHLALPKLPHFDVLERSAAFERTQNLHLCLADCLFDSWFFELNAACTRVISCFYLELQDFIHLQQGRKNVRSKELSRIINTREKKDKLIAFVEETLGKKRKMKFCIPEDSITFETFLDEKNIDLLNTYCYLA